MCGIAGIIDLEGDRDIDRDALKRMADALAHRGPDGEGFFYDKGVGLAHRRLAVIDVDGGAQPFVDSSGGVLSFNGEIYNFQDLAKDLERDGVRLKTRSDTEVLAEGLSREGPDFIQRLRGMFAFAYWDRAERTLLLARDRLGEKPLYYGQSEDGFFVFASELGAVAASGLFNLEFNVQAVADYFFYGYVPDPKSIYHDIRKLSPAHVMTANRGAPPAPSAYWRPVFAPSNGLSFEAAAEMLRARIDDAVAAQMISDVPLGAFLSGGVDSGGVVAAMAETGAKPVACTIGFAEKTHDERAGAREIAQRFGALHHEHVAGLDAGSLIDRAAAAFGEPFGDVSALPSYLVASLARRHVTVALTGDGGDELFAGYRRYPFFLGEEKLRAAAPLFFRRAVFGPLGALYPKLDWAPRALRAKTTLQAIAASRAEAYAAAVAINLPSQARAMLNPEARAALGDYHPQSVVAEAMAKGNGSCPLAAAQHADLLTWLPGRMLVKVDRTSMAHGLEARPPMLDHRLVEWAGLLPQDFKIKDGERKRILKAALAPRLGEEFVRRRKRGFDMPVSAWFRAAESPLADRLRRSKAWRESGFLDERTVANMLSAHQSGRRDWGQELWTVLMFDAFLRAA